MFKPILISALVTGSILPAEALSPPVDPTRHHMLVSSQWLHEHLLDPQLVIVHVAADSNNYVQGHIPGARFLSWDQIAVSRNGIPNEMPPLSELVQTLRKLGIDGSKRIILYDEGAGLQAARAYVALDYVGLGNQASLLDGHWKLWQAEQYPKEDEFNKIAPSNFMPRLNLNVISFMTTVQDAVWQQQVPYPNVKLLDARPPAEYQGTVPGEGIQRPGHIPGAINLFWMNHVESAERPVLKSPAALRKLFNDAGFQQRQAIVAYCRSGGQASHSYFVSKYLGFDIRLYDGSFSEWQSDLRNPVVNGGN